MARSSRLAAPRRRVRAGVRRHATPTPLAPHAEVVPALMPYVVAAVVVVGIVALLVREQLAPRRLAQRLAIEDGTRAITVVQGSGAHPVAALLELSVAVTDVGRATAALRTAPQSHLNVRGPGGDFLRHVLVEGLSASAPGLLGKEPWSDATTTHLRATLVPWLAERGFELRQLRVRITLPYDREARAREGWKVCRAQHVAIPGRSYTLSGLELYLDGITGADEWRVRSVRDQRRVQWLPSSLLLADPELAVHAFTDDSRLVRSVRVSELGAPRA